MSDLKFLKKVVREAIAREKYGLLTEAYLEPEERGQFEKFTTPEVEEALKEFVATLDDIDGMLEKAKGEVGSFSELGTGAMMEMFREGFLEQFNKSFNKAKQQYQKYIELVKASVPEGGYDKDLRTGKPSGVEIVDDPSQLPSRSHPSLEKTVDPSASTKIDRKSTK